MIEYYLGIDVGFSENSRTTGLCLITIDAGEFQWYCDKTGSQEDIRRERLRELIPRGASLASVGIDGPLASGLRTVNRYRSAEALLSRGSFQRLCKPGPTNVPTGQRLHSHATQLAELVVGLVGAHYSLDLASHPGNVCQHSIIEAFPTAFLALLLNESEIPLGISRGEKSDAYWSTSLRRGNLWDLINHLVPNCQPVKELDSIADHDERAAFVCALAGMCVARRKYVAVGDPSDGQIILPPREAWGLASDGQARWAEAVLEKNVDAVRMSATVRPNHTSAQVWSNGDCWLPRQAESFPSLSDGSWREARSLRCVVETPT